MTRSQTLQRKHCINKSTTPYYIMHTNKLSYDDMIFKISGHDTTTRIYDEKKNSSEALQNYRLVMEPESCSFWSTLHFFAFFGALPPKKCRKTHQWNMIITNSRKLWMCKEFKGHLYKKYRKTHQENMTITYSKGTRNAIGVLNPLTLQTELEQQLLVLQVPSGPKQIMKHTFQHGI